MMSTNDMSATASTMAMTATSKMSGKSTAAATTTRSVDVAPTPHTISAVVIDEDENEDMGGAACTVENGKNSAAPVTPSPAASGNKRNTHNPTAANGSFPFDEHDEIMLKSNLTGTSSDITPQLQEPKISWRGHKKHTRVTTSTTKTTTTTNLRDSSDIRSPGVCATPLSETMTTSTTTTSIPDFITQTDAHGNPVAPVTPTASSSTSWLVEEENDDTGNSYFEPLRVMCCCLSLEDDGGGGSTGGTTPKSKLNSSKSAPSTTSTSLVVTPPSAINTKYVLPPPKHHDKKCLVLDLDETLVHSSFRVVPNVDFVIPVTVDSTVHSVYVAKRPHVDQFLKEMAEHYELVIYTASLNKYADPLLDLLDPHRVIAHRLFREHCVYFEGHYVKDLRLLNRPLSKTIIVDNSPNSYLFHPENAIDCTSFIDDRRDEELLIISDFLKGVKHVEDVRHFCNIWRGWPNVEISTAITTSSVRIETDDDDDEDTKQKAKYNTTNDGNSIGRQNGDTADISLSVCALISDEWFV
jgi:RNA polymerase II subunit A small phosphatase-like protein